MYRYLRNTGKASRAHMAPRDELLHLVPQPPTASPLSYPSSSSGCITTRGPYKIARGEDVVEEGAAHGEYAMVEEGGRLAVGHIDVRVAAIKVRVGEQQPLEVLAELIQAYRLHVVVASSSSTSIAPLLTSSQRQGLWRPQWWRHEGAGATSIATEGGWVGAEK